MDDKQTSVQLPISVDPISEKEVLLVIKQLRNGKSAGADDIGYNWNCSSTWSDSSVPHLTDLCNMVWQQECAPAGWKNIIPLQKKGDLSGCSNWRGITLLSVTRQGVFHGNFESYAGRCRPVISITTSWFLLADLARIRFYLEADHRESDRIKDVSLW